MMLAASRPAFFAPGTPIASVPTATPAGICAMERSESIPLSAFDSTGTPSTGSHVCAAIIPGKCAAPPAPAMMTRNPRSGRVAREVRHQIRRAMRGDDLVFARHAEFRRASPRRAASSPNRTGCP